MDNIYVYNLKKFRDKKNIEELSSERLKRAIRFSEDDKLEDFLKAEYITENLLKRESGLDIKIIGKIGEKPFTNDENYNFSRSTDSNIMAIAISNSFNGIDIKKISSPDALVMKYYFNNQEKNIVNNANEELKSIYYTLIWTVKESVIKNTGQGLKADLINLDISFESEINLNHQVKCICKDIFITSFIGKNFIISVSNNKKVNYSINTDDSGSNNFYKTKN